MGALMSSCQLLVKMNSLKDSEDAKTMPTDTKGATDDTKTVFNDTEVANKAAMAGKLNVEHSEIVIKKDDVEHHSVTENAMIVSTKVTAKEMAKAAMAGKLKSEHAEAVIKDNADHSFTENIMIVSTKVTAKEMAKAAMAGKPKSEHAEAVIKDNADHHKVTDDAKIVLNDIEDASTEVTTKNVAIVGHKMPDKVNAEPKERPCTHLWTDLMVTQTGGTKWADPGMDSPDKPATHEYKIL
jgi:hypothetical protein